MSEKEPLSVDTAKRTGVYHIMSKEKCNILMKTRKMEKYKEKAKEGISCNKLNNPQTLQGMSGSLRLLC